MEAGLKSLSGSSATNSPSSLMARYPFPLLPLPAHLQASPPQQRPSWQAAADRPVDLPAKKSPRKPAASAPIVVAASPTKKRAAGQEEVAGWTSMYSVSPPPSSVPMPTSLLLAAASGRKKVPTPCAVEMATAGAGGGVDVGATDELRRLLRL